MNNTETTKGIAAKLGITEVLAEKIHKLLSEQLIEAIAANDNITINCQKTDQPNGISLTFRMTGLTKEHTLEIFEHRSEAE